MYQLRTYTLRTTAALEEYATARWPRDISSLRAFGITTNGIWNEHDADAHRLVALIAYPNGADPTDLTTAYTASPGFAADLDGFDVDNIAKRLTNTARPGRSVTAGLTQPSTSTRRSGAYP